MEFSSEGETLMLDYRELKKTHGQRISQTLDSPIMFAGTWELSEIILALMSVLFFGIMFYSWVLMILSLVWILIASPIIKKHNNKGILFHYLYKKTGMRLPGLMNPRGPRKYSD